MSGSHVSGSAKAIEDLQRSSQRYYQRPDAPHVELDPQRHVAERLYRPRVPEPQQRGLARQCRALGRQSRIRVERSRISQQGRSRRRARRAAVAQADAGSLQPIAWVVGRESVDLEFQSRAAERHLDGMRQRARSRTTGTSTAAPATHSDAAGRPDARWAAGREPQGNWANVGFSTDGRKWLSFDHVGRPRLERVRGISATTASCPINLKPLPSLSISTGPSLSRSRNLAQYLQTEDDATLWRRSANVMSSARSTRRS